MARHPRGTLALWRSRWLPAAFALASIVVATAFLTRALALGGALDMALGLACLPVAVVMALLAWDARRPVLVFDPHGARLRVGAQWLGLPWEDITEVSYVAPRGLVRDGRVVVVPNRERVAVTLGAAHARRVDAPQGLSVSVDRASHWVGAREPWVRLRELMPESVRLVGVGEQRAAYAANVHHTPNGEAPATRSDLQQFAENTVGALGASVNHAVAALQARVRPTPLTPESGPLVRPSVGAPLRVARQRQRLSIEALAAQSSIPVEVVAAIEGDDFAACGSDFYVRGYLRTLARITQIDPTELITAYDLYYAPAPDAQLSEPSPARSSSGRSTWSLVLAVGLAGLLTWSTVQVLTNPPPRAADFVPVAHDLSAADGGVPLVVSATGGGARVEIREADGSLVFKGKLPFGATQSWQVTTPVHVKTSDGSLTVELDGHVEGPMGAPGKDAANVYAVAN